jgi:S-adenosylmethionine:tRNA ribosyltransferase-isomerase
MDLVVRTDLFDYTLPEEQIAQRPELSREAAKLLVVKEHRFEHHRVKDLVELIEPNSLLVLNQTRVLHARLLGRRVPGGGRVEILLLRQGADKACWTALGKANRPLRAGDAIEVGTLNVSVLDKSENGTLLVRLRAPVHVDAALAAAGQLPQPP